MSNRVLYSPGRSIEKYKNTEKIEYVLNIIRKRKKEHIKWRHEMEHVIGDNHKFPLISVITPTIRKNQIHDIINNFNNQLYPNKELIIVAPKNTINKIDNNNIKLVEVNSPILGKDINIGIENSNGNIIAKMDDDDYYTPEFLMDQYLHYVDVDPDITGTNAIFIWYEDEKLLWYRYFGLYNQFAMDNGSGRYKLSSGGTLFFKRKVWEKCNFREIKVSEDSCFQRDAYELGFNIYLNDSFSYCYVRKHSDFHTFKRGPQHVGYPIYNNINLVRAYEI
ncbi:MAG: glycosyltransferase [Candidatus Lokiarchaeota archaeon]|nr:glycosyltransferase [Candidatus Lokiarchaeota archaeon]MBD3199581.1 glycosyltransferase [Candidatus Lokiarchaeota archaeon]